MGGDCRREQGFRSLHLRGSAGVCGSLRRSRAGSARDGALPSRRTGRDVCGIRSFCALEGSSRRTSSLALELQSTPSLPCAPIGNRSQSAATVLACSSRFCGHSICARLPPVAAALLHKCSIRRRPWRQCSGASRLTSTTFLLGQVMATGCAGRAPRRSILATGSCCRGGAISCGSGWMGESVRGEQSPLTHRVRGGDYCVKRGSFLNHPHGGRACERPAFVGSG